MLVNVSLLLFVIFECGSGLYYYLICKFLVLRAMNVLIAFCLNCGAIVPMLIYHKKTFSEHVRNNEDGKDQEWDKESVVTSINNEDKDENF
jgi:hypothetical protein